MTFNKGQSGNPSGRPKGAVSKRSQLSKLLEPHAHALIDKAVELALTGEPSALRLCIERLIPRAKEETLEINDLSGSLAEKSKQVISFITNGTINPIEGTALLQALLTQSKLTETTDLIDRIEKLESRHHVNKKS